MKKDFINPELMASVQTDVSADNALVSGVFTADAALLFLKSHFCLHPLVSGSATPDKIDALYVYYQDDNLQWMCVFDICARVRMVAVYSSKNQVIQCSTYAEKVIYREAC